MGLSRRQFTKEFKLAAIQRLERGASLAEVARAFEVNPSVLHRWQREFRQGPGNVFPGIGKRRWEEGQVAQLERKIGQQALEIDFLKGCLQRIDEQRNCRHWRESRYLRADPNPKGGRRSLDGEADVRTGGGEAVGGLSLSPRPAGAGSGHETP